ncbi:MAG TPA: HAD family phosphatase [Patescibacteria group bacterium]
MKKAFLFDMDGVLVNSENTWHKYASDFASKLYGEEILSKIGDTTGLTVEHEYEIAKSYGFKMNLNEFYKKYDEEVKGIYEKTEIVPGLEYFVKNLKEIGFVIGIVSSSRRPWVNIVLEKIDKPQLFDYSLSLSESNIPSKPSPKGYKKAMSDLGVNPSTTFILEDSNSGITAGKKSGAFTIAFTQFLVPGYKQIRADAKAASLSEVLEIVKEKLRSEVKII